MSANGAPGDVSPDAALAALYKSSRPHVELVPGVSLSAIVNATWIPTDAKSMLSQSWIPTQPEVDEGQDPPPPPPAFDPAAAEYGVMQRRLSKSAPFLRWNELMITIKTLETQLEREKDEKVKEEKTAALESARVAFAETELQLTELKASFAEDPTSLVPWMTTLFDLADAGLTTFDVSGSFFPHAKLHALFASDNTTSYYGEPEAVLGAFKRRYDRERGPGKVQLLTRLVPNIFQDGYSGPSFVEAVVDRIRAAVLPPESQEPLDLVQLFWWDVQEGDAVATLKALQALTEDKLDLSEEGEQVAVLEPRKVRAIGLVDFPSRAVISAIQAGVPVVSLSIPFTLADRSHQASLEVAREYNIKVLARDGLMGGLISEKYLGHPCPSTSGEVDPDLDDVAAAVDLANNYGGWAKVQALLRVVSSIAQKHGVKMQTVALRWQVDLGMFPVATTRWGRQCWSQFGFPYWRGSTPGLDWQLFQVESFLDAQDMAKLHALGY
ncbi:radial spoke protein 5 [Haematococcus lacustris]